MAAVTFELFLALVLCTLDFGSSNDEEVTCSNTYRKEQRNERVEESDCSSTNIHVAAGDSVNLTCVTPRKGAILMLQWLRPDLKPDGFVFFYRDGRLYENYLHQTYQERVKLCSPDINCGNATVTLHNASESDNGRYECHVTVSGSGRSRRAHTEVARVINLHVTPQGHREDGGDQDGGEQDEGDKRGHVGLTVGLPVPVLLVVAVVGSVFHRKHQSHRSKEQISVQQPVDGETVCLSGVKPES